MATTADPCPGPWVAPWDTTGVCCLYSQAVHGNIQWVPDTQQAMVGGGEWMDLNLRMGGTPNLGIIDTHSAEKDLPRGPEKPSDTPSPPHTPHPQDGSALVGAKEWGWKGKVKFRRVWAWAWAGQSFLIMFFREAPRHSRGAPGALKII